MTTEVTEMYESFLMIIKALLGNTNLLINFSLAFILGT